jgi:hypothetical protein
LIFEEDARKTEVSTPFSTEIHLILKPKCYNFVDITPG